MKEITTAIASVTVQWRTTQYDGGMELWVNDVHYTRSPYYVSDVDQSSKSGFATFQNCLNLSKQGLINLNILKS
jgi:hypothetical protein